MKRAAIIGVPMDLGASRRGVDMGPSAIRVTHVARLIQKLGYDIVDKGDVDVPIPEEVEVRDASKKYAHEIQSVCEALRKVVMAALEEERLPIVLGGDHSIAMGSISGVSDYHHAHGKKIGVIWMDAHGDMNTPTSSPSGNVHGMPLAHMVGLGDRALASIGGRFGKVDPANTCIVGARDLDEREKTLIRDSGVHMFTMKDVDRYGAAKVMEQAIQFAGNGTAGIHVSFDIDAVDPMHAPGVGTPKKGGLNYREAHLCMELVSDSDRVLALDMVEVNPIFDDRNRTAELASELILSALGKTIF
jgi:arginase